MSNARIIGRIDAVFRRDGSPAGASSYLINHISLDGAIPSGKSEVSIGPADSTDGAIDDIKDALAVVLNAKYPGHNYRGRDIIGCSI
jgi:hypothetical protein